MALWSGYIIGGILFNNKNAFPDEENRFNNSISYIFVAILLCFGTIGYSMALSTLFEEPAVA